MAQRERPLKDYAVPSEEEPHSSIAPPNIEARNFELKPALLQIVQQNQFSGSPTEDPNLHLSVFVQYADTIKANGVEPEAIRLRLFPFSLRDRARAWLQALPTNSITTWNELKKQFLARYFPPSKTAMLRAQINGFRQKEGESLFEAWERYKDMMRLCPHHGLEQWLIIHTFYNGLLYNTRLTIDAAAGGALMDKPYQEATQLIENMAQNHYQWGSERAAIEKSQTKGGMYEVSGIDHVNAKIEALSQKIESLTLSPAATIAAVQPNCELCGVPGHITSECQLLAGLDQANCFQNQIGVPVAPVAPQKSNFELMMENFVLAQTQQNKEFMNQNIHTNELIKQLANKIDSISTHNKMLETQISQVAQQQAATAALAGTLLGQPQSNPKCHVNAITLQSGTELEDPAAKRVRARDLGKIVEKDSESVTDKDAEREPIAVEDGQTSQAKEVIENDQEKPYVPPPPYKPPIPYPQRLAKSKNPGQFEKFIEMLKRLHIDIPFIEAITQIPSYAKFLKEILSNKRKIEDIGQVECNAISENKLAPKLEDPGNFSIPCVVGRYVIDKALCDLGASVSLMPLSICKRLGLGELKPTKMSLQLADRSIKYPLGILENVPVRIGKLFIPTDFVIMDIREDIDIPILLGRPFLATAGAIINVKKGKLTFEVGDEKIEFILSQFTKGPTFKNSCCRLEKVEGHIDKPTYEQVPPDILKPRPVNDIFQDIKHKKGQYYENVLGGFPDTHDQIFKECQMLAHGKIHTVKKKPSPPLTRKKAKGKEPMRWFDVFKWISKDVEYSVKDVSLKEAPS
ncbi:uncharacterized protein LOC123886512 [Trifolium pratense]|uniref:uncharacterized protein LOC123886512 n=1 Tax=Trifolium pratense TaxID=57577 RepID=UPI001E695A87|nr:uncharacterized protein LOC123886512 [Trifolium pratense]